MPSFIALVVATLSAWIVRDALPAGGGPLPMLLAGLFWIFTFYFVRRWFEELRPDL
ncbi:MAG: hypothetical protein JRH10_07430 [Deltaproteobacteria bacterium]|nr:hypothetical protein [Deltaproteobacteria bacterium]MBW2447049.1 hypothetical protein [Deltaproteobacteria bacterium]